MIPAKEWLALVLCTESNRQSEWPALAWAIRNRVETAGFPDTYEDVVAQPWQFSFFNDWIGKDLNNEEVWYEAIAKMAARDGVALTDAQMNDAAQCAEYVMSAPGWLSPFSHRVRHFWAFNGLSNPEAIRLHNSAGVTVAGPRWAKQMRVFQMPGNTRWAFAED